MFEWSAVRQLLVLELFQDVQTRMSDLSKKAEATEENIKQLTKVLDENHGE